LILLILRMDGKMTSKKVF